MPGPTQPDNLWGQVRRPLVKLTLSWLALTVLGGLIGFGLDPQHQTAFLAFLKKSFENKTLGRVENTWVRCGSLFFHNVRIDLTILLLGYLLAFIPHVLILFNAIVIGIALGCISARRGLIPTGLAILPHGIFEIPAMLLAGSLGLTLNAWKQDRHPPLSSVDMRGMARWIWLTISLTAVAALIEGTLSHSIAAILFHGQHLLS